MWGYTLLILVCTSTVITMHNPEVLSEEPEDCSRNTCCHKPMGSGTRLKGYGPPNQNPNDPRYGKARPWEAGDGSLHACVRHCCEHPPCNYAHMANGKCYQFTCGEDPKVCSPKKQPRGHADESAMVVVRPPQKFRGCRRDNASSRCMPNEICAHDNGRLICKCPGNFTTDSFGHCINPDEKRTGTVRPNQPPIAHAGDEATLIIVKKDPPKIDLLRVVLDCSFSNADLAKLEQALPSLLPRTKFVLRSIQSEGSTGNVMLVFYRSDASTETVAESQLLQDLAEVVDSLAYPVLSVAFGLDADSPPVIIVLDWTWTPLGILMVVAVLAVAVAGVIYVCYPLIKCDTNGRTVSVETNSRVRYTMPEYV